MVLKIHDSLGNKINEIENRIELFGRNTLKYVE